MANKVNLLEAEYGYILCVDELEHIISHSQAQELFKVLRVQFNRHRENCPYLYVPACECDCWDTD